ncbi:MAG: ComEC/Rec2 family competence protein [Crocinitomicaceae bacterium]|nr:ComEC/Rec2 family competence protein [Crocinitomicaceae bacterium]
MSISDFFALSGIWFYAILTGLTPSVLRAAVMFSFVLIGSELQRDTSIYQSLMISAIILLLIDPNVLFQLGFLLSYFAVIGIVFFHPKIYALFFFKNKLMDKIWQVTCVSIAAQLATFPLGIYCFQQFPNYFLIANLIVIPISFFVLDCWNCRFNFERSSTTQLCALLHFRLVNLFAE